MAAAVTYALEPQLSVQDFRAILIASTLGARRPVDDDARLAQMLRQADIIVVARSAQHIVGVARSITDFAYCCYLSDLAVAEPYQRHGIGKQLIAETRAAAGRHVGLYLVSAPAALGYYPKIGLQPYPCFGLPREDRA